VRYGELAPRAIDLPRSCWSCGTAADKNDCRAACAHEFACGRATNAAVLAANLRKGTSDEELALRWLWTLHGGGGLDEALALELLDSAQAYVQAWTIQLACERGQPGPALLAKLNSLANSTPSPVVRLYLASALQRFPNGARLDLAAPLLARAEDSADHNLPLMLWYAIEPAVPHEPARALELARGAKLPNIQRFVLRRLAADVDQHEFLLSQLVAEPDPKLRLVLLEELESSSRRAGSGRAARLGSGRGLGGESPAARVRELAQSIAVAYGDVAGFALVRASRRTSRATHRRVNAVEVVARARPAVGRAARLLDEPALSKEPGGAVASTTRASASRSRAD
jgi:hypothetical protein